MLDEWNLRSYNLELLDKEIMFCDHSVFFRIFFLILVQDIIDHSGICICK